MTTASVQERLADAIATSIISRLRSNLAYLRVPELATPFPAREVLDQLASHDLHARAAVFVESRNLDSVGGISVTRDVHTAITWRDDPESDVPLLIFGDLERNRAAGLLSVRVLRAVDVRANLFARTIQQVHELGLPVPLARLLTNLRDDVRADLTECADYCGELERAGAGMADAARSELWRVGLLPDLSASDLDRSRLADNAALVAQLRSSDAATVQRLLVKLSGTPDFGAVRAYAKSRQKSKLKNLDYDTVKSAFRSVGKKSSKKKAGGKGEYTAPSLLTLLQDSSFSQDDFLRQLSDSAGAQSEVSQEGSVTISGSSVPWESAPVDSFAEWLSPAGVGHYAEIAGSTVDLDAAARQTVEESIRESRWIDLTEALRILKTLEARLEQPLSISAASACERLIDKRAALLPYIAHIPHEGVRLFATSARILDIADSLVETWVDLWSGLSELHGSLDSADREYVSQVGQILAASDVRVEVSGDAVTAHLLPLHPIVIEPRVAAAKVLRKSADDIGDDFIELLVSAVDPGMPGISVNVADSKRALSYSGVHNHLPIYEARPRQAEGGEVGRTVQQLIERFINVHPYTQLSLSVALVGLSPRLAKSLIKWLGGARSERVRLDLFTASRDVEEMQEYVDEAVEELASTEADPDRFQLQVHEGDDVSSLPRRLKAGSIRPHLVVAFNAGDSTPGKFTSKFVAPLQGSVITQWSFNVNPITSRPVIRPTSGSGRLIAAADKQQDLTGLGPPTQERSPLLSESVVKSLDELGGMSTWVALCEGVSPLAAPSSVGDLRLLGRLIAGTHVAYVYSSNTRMLLEPVLTYLQQSTWIHPEKSELQDFLLKTVRMALPEGLLGFFKARGALSSASVLGRLGLAAVLAYLQEETEDDARSLVVSLDTEAARQWLNLREGPDRRADLLIFSWSGERVVVTAAEVKSRTDALRWSEGSQPEAVSEALDQVNEMAKVLRKIFGIDADDPLTPSRREIVKRQVFLEALQQWDGVREKDLVEYEDRVRALNRLFDAPKSVLVESRIFVVGTNEPGDAVSRVASDGQTPVLTLGVPWLKKALQSKAGGHVELDAALLDEFQDLLDAQADSTDRDAQEVISVESADEAGSALGDVVGSGTHDRDDDLAASDELVKSGGELSADSEGRERESRPRDGSGDEGEPLEEWASRLRESLLARNAPLREIDISRATVGPSVVQIPIRLARGARLATLQAQESDIARELGSGGVRISNWPQEAGFACIELPRKSRHIGDVSALSSPATNDGEIKVALGAQLDYQSFVVGLNELPHLLVAGTTGSGKSVFLRSILWQLTHFYGPESLDVVIIDAKGMSDYIDFKKAPHIKAASDYHSGVAGAVDLLANIVDERLPARRAIFNEYAAEAIDRDEPVQIANVMDLLRDAAHTGRSTTLRPLVVLVDEFAELVMATADRKRFETLVTRFNQIARAIGGHLIAATQRPSADVVTGVMKSNFARLALRVQSAVDSRVILDEGGAESLMGKGDLLFRSSDQGVVRLQGYNAAGPYRF